MEINKSKKKEYKFLNIKTEIKITKIFNYII